MEQGHGQGQDQPDTQLVGRTTTTVVVVLQRTNGIVVVPSEDTIH